MPLRLMRSAAWLGMLALLFGCGKASAPVNELNDLVGRCVTAMVNDTCRVMQGTAPSLIPPGSQTVIVAGIGAIDAELYQSLRSNGEAMCQKLRQVCSEDWRSNACKTAQALYPVAATPAK